MTIYPDETGYEEEEDEFWEEFYADEEDPEYFDLD
jgi:hypothetical protein